MVKKSAFFTLTGLLLCLFTLTLGYIDRALAARPAYAMETEFYQSAGLAIPSPDGGQSTSLLLAVTITPNDPELYLYASKSQALGRSAEIGVFSGDSKVSSHAVFPMGVEKSDPLRAGKTTRVFQGAFVVLVPLPEGLPENAELAVRLSGLTCSAVNCTLVILEKHTQIPNLEVRDSLPYAAISPWWPALQSGIIEPLATAPGPDEPPALKIAALPLAREFTQTAPILRESETFLEAIRPRPFTPGLEVSSLGKAVLLGFLAGIILNLMPCVLPVLGIKLAALLNCNGGPEKRVRRFRRHQIFFSCGILAWFTTMAALFHFLDLAWGQIFQSPAVVLTLAIFLLLLALNMFGILTLPLIDFRTGTHKNPDLEAFASGFTATLLATPCGGPLLGGVLSWALLQPFGILTLTLESVGLGMAFPYLLLTAFPSLAAKLPRPGNWMVVIEQILGFILLGTVAYLTSFLPSNILPRVLAALILAAFGGWLWGKSAAIEAPRRYALRSFAVVCIAMACLWPLRERVCGIGWAAYSQTAMEGELGQRVILVDFTADWCPTCKVVEATALADEAVAEWKERYDPALFRVDMTRENPEGEALLRAVGCASIPVIAVFGTGENAYAPLVLRDVVTRGQVNEAMEQASNP